MPVDDYSSAVSGGLKLKGVNSSSKISKHKKKKPKPETDPAAVDQSKDEAVTQKADQEAESKEGAAMKQVHGKDDSIEENGDATSPSTRAGKTEAELRHEERRRKRLDERLKREGTKTHKERVEELNRYLSNLSEHHDMPRIGPG